MSSFIYFSICETYSTLSGLLQCLELQIIEFLKLRAAAPDQGAQCKHAHKSSVGTPKYELRCNTWAAQPIKYHSFYPLPGCPVIQFHDLASPPGPQVNCHMFRFLDSCFEKSSVNGKP